MRSRGGGFGFVMLLLVLAIVAYVAMRNTQSVAPAALEIKKHNERRDVNGGAVAPDVAAEPASGDAWNPSPPSRPSLTTVDQKTSEHATNVQDALSQAQ